MKISQIAINSISTARPSFEETVKAYADAGFKQIEFNIPFLKEWMKKNGKNSRDAKSLLAQHGMRSIGGFECGVCAFGSESERAQNREVMLGNTKLLDELGGGTLVLGTDGPQSHSVDALKTIGQAVAALAKESPESVKLAIEFNWSPIVKSLRSAAICVEAAAHPRVGILFDPAHYHCTSSKFEDLTQETVKKIVHVHVNDMRNKPGELSNCNSDRVLPGEGTLDLKKLFGRLDEYGYKGAYSIELFNDDIWKLPVGVAAEKCFAGMKSLCS
jgi:sugar phosphate isomerase/epimerase